jgi:hypothetical protein
MLGVDMKPPRRSLQYAQSQPPEMKRGTKEVCKDVAAVQMLLSFSSSDDEELNLLLTDDDEF